MFCHEDLGGQLLWALQRYVSIDEEGPESAFFNPTPLQGQGAAGAVLPAAAAGAGGGNIQQQHQALLDKQQEILPAVIQELIGCNHLDHDEEVLATAAASMVDDDNKPAPENQPNPNETVDDIFSGWTHSGICHCRISVHHNMKPELKFWRGAEADLEPSNIDLFWGCFFRLYQEHNCTTNKQQLESRRFAIDIWRVHPVDWAVASHVINDRPTAS